MLRANTRSILQIRLSSCFPHRLSLTVSDHATEFITRFAISYVSFVAPWVPPLPLPPRSHLSLHQMDPGSLLGAARAQTGQGASSTRFLVQCAVSPGPAGLGWTGRADRLSSGWAEGGASSGLLPRTFCPAALCGVNKSGRIKYLWGQHCPSQVLLPKRSSQGWGRDTPAGRGPSPLCTAPPGSRRLLDPSDGLSNPPWA